MKNLDWFQAHRVARRGRPIRREEWRKWLTYEGIWPITQPQIESTSNEPGQEARRAVAQNFDFASAEFNASDWTDEPWNGGVRPPDNPHGDPVPPNGDPDIPWPDDDPLRPPGTPANPPGNPPGGTGSGGGGNNGGGSGGGSGTGSGGGGGGGIIVPPHGWGDGGGGMPPHPAPPIPPPKPKPHAPDAVPTVTVSVAMSGSSVDGPGCFITVPTTVTLAVTVTVAGGPAGVGLISVDCPVGTVDGSSLGTASDGFTHTYNYLDVPFTPGGTVTVEATYSAPPQPGGDDYVGEGSITFPPECLIVSTTFTGTLDESRETEAVGVSGAPATGYTHEAAYETSVDYAFHPADGDGKTGVRSGAVTGGIYTYTHTEVPSGTITTGEVPIDPPMSITADIASSVATNRAAPMDVFGESESSTTESPHSVFTKTVSETIG